MVAPIICYEVEFPEMVRQLKMRGTDVVLVVTAVEKGYSGEFLTSCLIRTRAFENNVYVAYCNRVGDEGGMHFLGRSLLASPMGEVVAQLSDAPGELHGLECCRDKIKEAEVAHPFIADLRQSIFK